MNQTPTFHQASALNLNCLAAYEEWLAQQDMSSNTRRVYCSRIKQFLFFLDYAKGSDDTSFDQSDLNRNMSLYLKFLKQSQKGNSTINANVNALKNFCQFLGVSTELQRERCYTKNLKVLTFGEEARFLRSINKQELSRDRALAFVLISTGLRIGDCARLKVQNIGEGAASICLDNGVTVKLDLHTTYALRQWLEDRKRMSNIEHESGLWLTKNGTRLKISGITSVIERIGWQANLVISVETLRRTCLTKATTLLNRDQLASRYGGYVGKAAIKRYGVSLSV